MPSRTVCRSRIRGNVSRRATAILAAFLGLAWACPTSSLAQALPGTDEAARILVQDLKQDPRGPFQGIRWFCPDGSIIAAASRCVEPGGIQHGLLRDAVVRLQRERGIHLGQVLAGTPFESFLDDANRFSRLKQYQMERYLIRTDDGWILRKARYYRGAYQAEDEEDWGRRFLEWALGRDELVRSWFFVLREATRDVPHAATTDLIQDVRAGAKNLSDAYPPFLDLRVKIHGQPEASDTVRVAAFRRQQMQRMPPSVGGMLDRLLADMRRLYGADPGEHLRRLVSRVPAESEVGRLVRSMDLAAMTPRERTEMLADLVFRCREQILVTGNGRQRLRLMDTSIAAEALLFLTASDWTPGSPRDLLSKAAALARTAAGTGLIELWEWQELRPELAIEAGPLTITESDLKRRATAARRAVEWGIGTMTAAYEESVTLFSGFEPLVEGFLDDRLRSTVLLAMGEVAGRLGDVLATYSGRQNEVMGLAVSGIRGLNPGVAVGDLAVVESAAEHVEFQPDRVYVLSRTPAELKPVAGIATVTEGNVVSHVQLLARNLGIPNAVLSPDLVRQLEPMSGVKVFYAVSPGGAVRLKPAGAMTDEERAIVEERKRSSELIRVPVDRLDLGSRELTSLHDLRAGDSGRLCGPKAANLGQLNSLFPGKVGPGFIIPFGVFRRHMDQEIPDSRESYWDFLQAAFEEARRMRSAGMPEAEIDTEVLRRLGRLRALIERMPLDAAFIADVRKRYGDVFAGRIGQVPVFVRSDTNMEDLKDFTGAGLNLTVPNVVAEEALFDAIRRVWASPYRERGYRWRQRYLLNPEDVYPSILVLRSINVDRSGVMITSGVTTGRPEDVTVAFNRGVGGAVDGQAAESYVISSDGIAQLVSPAREPTYRVLPTTGGTEYRTASFGQRILSERDLRSLGALATEIKSQLPGSPGLDSGGPFDVELGFLGNEMFLFQVRPFVENRAAASTTYLSRMDQRPRSEQTIDPDQPLR